MNIKLFFQVIVVFNLLGLTVTKTTLYFLLSLNQLFFLLSFSVKSRFGFVFIFRFSIEKSFFIDAFYR